MKQTLFIKPSSSPEGPRGSGTRSRHSLSSVGLTSCSIIAAIEDPPVIVRILTHLGLPTRAPPRAPAQRVGLFQTI